jgi:replicative DNA helicase
MRSHHTRAALAGHQRCRYFRVLISEAATSYNCRDYALRIYELAKRRQLMEIGKNLHRAAVEAELDVTPLQIITEERKQLFASKSTASPITCRHWPRSPAARLRF